MANIQRLDLPSAIAGLRAAGSNARGFLGLDPVTQNDALLSLELARSGAVVLRHGDTLLGYLPNRDQPRQAVIATTSGEPGPIGAMVEFLHTYQRCTSFVATVPVDSTGVAAFDGSGFTRTGTLREHQYRGGRYRDLVVFFATREDVCRS